MEAGDMNMTRSIGSRICRLFYYLFLLLLGHCEVIMHYIISKRDILEINCSSIALLEKCISQDTEPLQGAYDKI